MAETTEYFKQMIPESNNKDHIERTVLTYQESLISFYHREISLNS